MQQLTADERDARNAAIKAEYDETDHSARSICDKYRIGSKTLYRIVDGSVRIPRIRQIAFGAGDGRRCAAGAKCVNDPDGTGAPLIRRDNERMCDFRERSHCGSRCRPGTPTAPHVDKKPRQTAEWPPGMVFADAGVAPMTYARAPRPDHVGFSATGNAALRCVGG